jgi:hypothetical protein
VGGVGSYGTQFSVALEYGKAFSPKGLANVATSGRQRKILADEKEPPENATFSPTLFAA